MTGDTPSRWLDMRRKRPGQPPDGVFGRRRRLAGRPDALKRGDASLHLAVLTTPFLRPLLNGIKIIEVRPRRQL